MDDIQLITHDRAMFVRPPYWRFNSNTRAGYHRHGLHMILSDAKAYDGVDWGQHIFRRWNFRSQLTAICRRIQHRDIPSVDGIAPIIVTFHDTNNYTASHLIEYFDLLIEESGRAGLLVDQKPFYDCVPDIMRASLRRAVDTIETVRAGPRCGEASLPCPHK
jgi:hypothetical protein